MSKSTRRRVSFAPPPIGAWASVIRDAVKMKKVMMKKGLRSARAKCPECEGTLWARLVGSKDHLHMSCTGTCNRSFME